MLDQQVMFAPSMYETGFISCAHDDAIINQTLEKAENAFANIKHLAITAQ